MQIEMEGWLWMHACFSNYAGYECIHVLVILLRESYALAGYECSPTLIQSETSICSLWALLRAVNWAAVLKIELFAPGKRRTVYHQAHCTVTQNGSIIVSLTLLGPGGGHIYPLCHVFAYISANTRTSTLKNLTFPNYKFRKGQYTFYPTKLSRFAERN